MDTHAPSPAHTNCPHCLAANDSSAEHCSACGQSLVLVIGDNNPYAPPSAVEPRASGRTFHIGSLMLLIALIAVCLSLAVQLPGLGVVGLLVLTPALIRTVHGYWRDQSLGLPMGWGKRFELFAASLGVVLAIELGTIAAFVATCFPIGLFSFQLYDPTIPLGMYLAFGIGIIAACAAGFFLIRQLWPRRNRRGTAQPHVPGDDAKPLS